MDCLRRKHHRNREHKKPRPRSPNVFPNHSQPSTMKTVINSTLPKVSSTGVWMDTPGVYAVAPPHSYYYGRPHSYNMYGVDHGYHHLPRALSETRIPQPDYPYVQYRPQFGSQQNMFLSPVPAQRFYYSQPLAPVYELPPRRGMEIYDYPYSGENGGFRSKLMETRHTPDYYNNTSQFILKARVERAKSDAEDRRPVKQPGRREQTQQSSTTSSGENVSRPTSRDNKNGQAIFVDDEKKILKSSKGSSGVKRAADEKVYGARVNNAFTSDSVHPGGRLPPSIISDPITIPSAKASILEDSTGVEKGTVSSSDNISSSLATDSMKLLAKNKTDDQKTKPSFSPVDSNANRLDENDREFNIKHYTYEGSIYAMPERKNKDTDYNNPIINRMKEMAIERTRHSIILTPTNHLNRSSENGVTSNGMQTVTADRNIYNGVNTVRKITETKVIESLETSNIPDIKRTEQQTKAVNDIIDNLVLPDILGPEQENKNSHTPRIPAQNISSEKTVPPVAASVNRNDVKDLARPVDGRNMDALSPKLSVDTGGSNEDLNRAGKQLATSAFKFLDNYLSDDEATESLVESPPLSPGGLKAGQVY